MQQKSQVIATSSIGGFNRVALAGHAYAASKAGTTHMMKQFSTALVPYGVCRFFFLSFPVRWCYRDTDFGTLLMNRLAVALLISNLFSGCSLDHETNLLTSKPRFAVISLHQAVSISPPKSTLDHQYSPMKQSSPPNWQTVSSGISKRPQVSPNRLYQLNEQARSKIWPAQCCT